MVFVLNASEFYDVLRCPILLARTKVGAAYLFML